MKNIFLFVWVFHIMGGRRGGPLRKLVFFCFTCRREIDLLLLLVFVGILCVLFAFVCSKNILKKKDLLYYQSAVFLFLVGCVSIVFRRHRHKGRPRNKGIFCLFGTYWRFGPTKREVCEEKCNIKRKKKKNQKKKPKKKTKKKNQKKK